VVPLSAKSARTESGNKQEQIAKGSRSEVRTGSKSIAREESVIPQVQSKKVLPRQPVKAVSRSINVIQQPETIPSASKSPRITNGDVSEFLNKQPEKESSSPRPSNSPRPSSSPRKESSSPRKESSSPRPSSSPQVFQSNKSTESEIPPIDESGGPIITSQTTIKDDGMSKSSTMSSKPRYVVPPFRDHTRSASTIPGRDDSPSLGETKTAKMKLGGGKYEKGSKRHKLYKKYNVPKGSQLVKAGERFYVVKKYHKMSLEDQKLEYTDMELSFRNLNRSWNRQGIHFPLPDPKENLVNIQIRLQQYRRFAISRMGSDSYKLMLIFGWVITETVLCYLGIPAQHYTETQIELFDLYQNRLIEMGELQGGFGQDWSPMTWILVMSAVNAAVLIGLNKMCEGKGAQIAMRSVTSLITGNKVAVDGSGVPLPPEQQPAAPNPIGEALNSFTGGDPTAENPVMSMVGKYLPTIIAAFNGNQVAKKKTPGARRGPTHG
jgi:hypothetical protein